MKILLGNNSFSYLAGSETYMLTLATELRRLGHEVTAYSPLLGLIATKLEAIGVRCINELEGDNPTQARPFSPILQESEGQFDVAICAHYEITRTIRKKFANIPIIAICHGILHSHPETGEIFPEHPVTDMKVDQYISVSEEIQSMLKNKYGIESIVMRNLFDLEKFAPSGALPEKPKSILINSNYWGVDDEINQIIKDVAKHYGARLMAVGANFVPASEVHEILKEADIVFGMGRSVMEGFCAGKIAVVHGRWGTGGVITPESYETLKKTNFSGRSIEEGIINNLLPAEEIIKQIDAAWKPEIVSANIELAKQNHDVKVIAAQFLDIANKLIK